MIDRREGTAMAGSGGTQPLRALVTGTTTWAVDAITRQLTAGGIDVRRCHEPGVPFPCRALGGGECSLDPTVDLVVTARGRSHPIPSPEEAASVTCALARGLPLLVVAHRPAGPLEELAAATIGFGDDVVAAARRVAAGSPARRGLVARLGDGR
jgi:hypothetical protein